MGASNNVDLTLLRKGEHNGSATMPQWPAT